MNADHQFAIVQINWPGVAHPGIESGFGHLHLELAQHGLPDLNGLLFHAVLLVCSSIPRPLVGHRRR